MYTKRNTVNNSLYNAKKLRMIQERPDKHVDTLGFPNEIRYLTVYNDIQYLI